MEFARPTASTRSIAKFFLLLIAACLCAAAQAASHGAAPSVPAIHLAPGAGPYSLSALPQVLAPRGALTFADAAAGRLGGHPEQPDGVTVPLSEKDELWIPLRLHNASDQPATWQFQVPQPSIDEVTLYESRNRRWSESSAGDRVLQSQWPRHGRYARFEMRFEPRETRQFVVRVRNAVPAPVPTRLVTDAAGEEAEQRAGIGFGLVLGMLALLVAACLVQGVVYRDSAYLLYGAYALLLGFAFSAISGLTTQYLWGDAIEWADVSKAVFPVAAAGVSVWLVRALCRVRTRGMTLSNGSAVIGGGVIAVAVAFAVLGVVLPPVMAVAMGAAALTVLAMALWTWRRGDPVGLWVFIAHAPLIGLTLLVMLRMFGIAPFEFDSSVATSLAIGAILPLLLYALHQRSREFLAVQERAREMPSIDPLTGLLAPRMFADRVRAAVRRWQRSRHNAAVLYIRVTNYPRIRETHGSAAAEQTMIRAAIRLQGLMPDADCIGRVSENTIGLIVETVTMRAALMERASRLVAHGLMPLKDLVPEIILNLHVVGNVLSENPLEAPALQQALENDLASMSARTRRPIRFLEAGVSRAAEAEADDQELEAPTQMLGGTADSWAQSVPNR
ncbi:sensor domain-containing diguanylate cyclase [Caenimonas aquaedulcis]|uniref:Diguanylate cyclase n=1 Tax=Caenimonas aquaedulcis TaxID=2793270 RepID=A0A931H516_9BURK|nr:diguanylate cyclase [Caenimonas aquaedulcis]